MPFFIRPDNWAGEFIQELFQVGLPSCNRDHASPPSHLNTSKFLKGKSGEERPRKPSQPS